MAIMTARSHVNNFLSSADPRGSFLRIAEIIVETAERDSETLPLPSVRC